MRPAFSTLRANSAFSERKPYPGDQVSVGNPGYRRVSRTRVDHLHAVLNGNFDNLITSQVRGDRGVLSSLANDVGFIGLCGTWSAKRSLNHGTG